MKKTHEQTGRGPETNGAGSAGTTERVNATEPRMDDPAGFTPRPPASEPAEKNPEPEKRSDDAAHHADAGPLSNEPRQPASDPPEEETPAQKKAREEAALRHAQELEQRSFEASQRAPADGLSNEQRETIRRVNFEFCRDVPQEARGGSFDATDHERFQGQKFDLPDGTYRTAGGDWFYTFRRGRLEAAAIATEANKYGGSKVVIVG